MIDTTKTVPTSSVLSNFPAASRPGTLRERCSVKLVVPRAEAGTPFRIRPRSARAGTLTLEHRSAPAPDPIALVLATGVDGTTPHLRRASIDETPPPADSLADRLLRLLRAATAPVSRVALPRQLGVKNLHLGQALTALEEEHVICRTAAGWSVSTASPAQLHLST